MTDHFFYVASAYGVTFFVLGVLALWAWRK